MIRGICLDIEGESLLLVVGDLIIDILFDVVGGDREIELKGYPNNRTNTRMYDAPTSIGGEDDIIRSDRPIEGFYLFLGIAIDAEDPSIFWEDF
jgi:hypothetical protein